MKKTALLITIAFIAFGINAQNFRGGALIGLSMSQIDGDTYSGYNKPGFIIGASVDKALSEHFTLAMEFKFIQKGSRASYDVESGSGEYYRTSLNYIQIPLLAQYNVWNNVWAEGGLGFGYLIDYKEEGEFGEIESVPFRKSEIAFLAGAAYDIPTTRLRVGIRYSYSIFPVRKIGDVENFGFYDRSAQYNNNFEFMLALHFK